MRRFAVSKCATSLALALVFAVLMGCEAGGEGGNVGQDIVSGPDVASAGLGLSREEVDFADGPVGGALEEELVLENRGGDPLRLSVVGMEGDASFSVEVSGESLEASYEGASASFDPPIELAAGARTTLLVSCRRVSPAAAVATLRVYGDTAAELALVTLSAPGDAVHMEATPAVVDFGAVQVGTTAQRQAVVEAFGVEDLVVNAVTIESEAPVGTFVVDAQTPAPPISLPPRSTQAVVLSYAPTACVGGEDGIVTHTATLLISAEGIEEPVSLSLTGRCPSEEAQHAAIAIEEDGPVPPQTILHLSNAGAAAPQYRWSVVQPVGSRGLFHPSAEVAEPTFTANVAGEYTFSLELLDAAGVPLTAAAPRAVDVVPESGLHVELLWHTPGDADETDEGPGAGADLDLHFVHPSAPGVDDAPDLDDDGLPDPWFAPELDCFWFNPRPEWASSGDGASDPRLDLDDTDGAGPENINLDIPEDGLTYGVGVHFWDDQGFGPSLVTVRIYLDGELAEELSGVELVDKDLWYVGDISWPERSFVPAVDDTGAPRIAAGYEPTL